MQYHNLEVEALAALIVLADLAVIGLDTPSQALSGFRSPVAVNVWAVLILSVGLTCTGVAIKMEGGPSVVYGSAAMGYWTNIKMATRRMFVSYPFLTMVFPGSCPCWKEAALICSAVYLVLLRPGLSGKLLQPFLVEPGCKSLASQGHSDMLQYNPVRLIQD